ncbi:MAG: MATE family efflux transporter [Deltaproteobacteria bacterium]|nr:MATE family efflux transporter [Deltaproteobacteria bacterium]
MLVSAYFRRHWAAPQGYREVLRIGLPMLASMASTTVMLLTDRIFLSRYSLEAIAASSPAGMASLTLQMTFQGVCGYAAVLAAQYTGARALGRVGAAMWQGIWCSLLCSVLLVGACFPAAAFFDFIGHEAVIRELEVKYFVVLTSGSSISLLGGAVSAYFFGRGLTKPVMLANMAAAALNILLDYLLIFGKWGFPELGITGAAVASVSGWALSLSVLSALVFTRGNDRAYHVLRAWRPEKALFLRLIRFGTPGGIQFFVEFLGQTWFMFELGHLGRIPLAASNIAFSINSFTFMPMLGLSMATSTLAGQAMGRGKPQDAVLVSSHALHLAFVYMLFMAGIIVFFSGELIDIFRAADAPASADFEQVRATGRILLYYVALYSLVDAVNLIFIGALKGAGDTLMIMKIIVSCVVLALLLPIAGLHWGGFVSLHKLWIIFTVYIFILALCVALRFHSRKWQKIRVIESTPPASVPGGE